MQNSVADLAWWFSVISFVMYFIQGAGDLVLRFKQQAQLTSGSPVGGAGAPTDIPDTLNAFAKLVENLNKSSPALLSLLASVCFLVIALLATSPLIKS